MIHANGVPWPYQDVEQRKYRFRILDGSSRSYKLSIEASSDTKIPVMIIATGKLSLTYPPIIPTDIDVC